MNKLSYLISFAVNDGMGDQLVAFLQAAVPSVEAGEPGTVRYQAFLSADGKSCIVLEEYADADAFMTHMGNMSEALPKLMEMATPTGVSVLGTPEGPALEALKGLGATFHTPIAGFER